MTHYKIFILLRRTGIYASVGLRSLRTSPILVSQFRSLEHYNEIMYLPLIVDLTVETQFRFQYIAAILAIQGPGA